ncbi:hypothetical protein ACIBJD_24045 [Kitasatospora sp. NPDC050467]|uniref:hypothetical protein n=1 Tax=Kitasatospora sp. NPDC050467 TaxID=3364053 RepID=UPI003795156E
MANQMHQWNSERMPSSIRWAVAGVWVHAVLNGLAGLFLFALMSGEDGEGVGLVRFVAVLSIMIAIVLCFCAALAPRRAGWTRITVLVIEWLSIISGVLQLFSGATLALAGLAIALLIVTAFMSHEGRRWFNA